MSPLTDFQTQILHQQLLWERRFVGEVVQDEGRVHGVCVDIEVAVWKINKRRKKLYDSADKPMEKKKLYFCF